MGGRDAVLARVRAALGDTVAEIEVPRTYRLRGSASAEQVAQRFADRVRDYRATVVESDDPAAAAGEALRAAGASRVVVASDLPAALRPDGIEVVEDRSLAAAELDALGAALTTCAHACADTGTFALDGGPGQGRRAISLVPDVHVCVVRRVQIVETVPELFERLAPSARAGRPIVLVSGPSATSDIGLERVEGVHGPRRLVVIVAP